MNKIVYFSILILFSVLFIETPNASTNRQNLSGVINDFKVVKMGPLDPRKGPHEEEENQSDKQPQEEDE